MRYEDYKACQLLVDVLGSDIFQGPGLCFGKTSAGEKCPTGDGTLLHETKPDGFTILANRLSLQICFTQGL